MGGERGMVGRLLGRVAGEAGLRFLGRRKASLAMAVITLSLALGANTVVFSVVKGFLLSSLALPEPDRTFVIAPIRDLGARGDVVFAEAYPNYRLLRETQTSFVDVSASLQEVSSWDDRTETRPVRASRVTASFFPAFGVVPLLGRAFEEREEGPSPAPVVIVGHDLWRSAMAGDPDVLGRTMILNGAPHTVVGVMPPGFAHPLPTEVWLPLDVPEPLRTAVSGGRSLGVHGRLRAGVTEAVARAEMATLTQRAIEASSDNEAYRYELRTIAQVSLPGADRTLLLVQLGAMALTLLAVANLSSLLVAWGYDRRQEMAVRVALGARGVRVGALLVVQSVAVVCAGGLGGVLVARGALPLLARLPLGAEAAPFLERVELDGSVLLVSALIAAVAGLAAGLVPAVLSRRAALADALRSGRSSSQAPAGIRWQRGMVAAQTVLTVLILSTAALLGLSFHNLVGVPDGFEPEGAVVARLQLTSTAYQRHEARVDFAGRLLRALDEEPALAASAFTSTLPVGDIRWGGRFLAELPDGTLDEESSLLHFRRASPAYLDVMGIPVLQGRSLADTDDLTQPPVAVVSRAAADALWPGQNAVGKPLYRTLAGGERERLEVVGVVGDVMDGGYETPPGEAVYVPYAQVSLPRMSVVARPADTPEEAIRAIRSALRRTDPDVAASDVTTLEHLVDEANALPRLQALLLVVFSVVALLIAGMGSFGLMSQLVASREREMALRLAVGASTASVGRSVLRQAAWIGAPGVVAGAALTLAMASTLRPFLFGVDPRSLSVTATVALATLALVAVAAVPPAWRAMRVHVVSSLLHG